MPKNSKFYVHSIFQCLQISKFKKVLGVSQRDLLIITKESEVSGGILVVSTSYNHHEYPEMPGVTRIQIDLAGYLLKDTDSGSEVFTVTQANFGGIVPHKAMKAIVAATIPRFHSDMQAAMEKNLDKDSNINKV